MDKKQATIAGAIAAVLLGLGTGAWIIGRGGDAKPSPIAASEPPPSTIEIATTTTTVESTPTTSVAPTNNQTLEPTERSLRAPVRCTEPGEPTTGDIPSDDPNREGKKWVTLQRLVGACDLSSNSFQLRGIDTRLVWRSDAGTFLAFLLDKEGLDATAGFPDADCFGPCADFQALVNQSGEYTLRVQADGGPWEVLIQEYR